MLRQIFNKIKTNSAISLIQNLSWMLIAEVISRLSRFVTLFILAANFSNTEYGLVMLALVIHELFRVFTKLGTGAKIIQCAPDVLLITLQNAATLQWLVAILTTIIQVLSANWIAYFYGMPELSDLIKVMALAHLCYPIVSVKIFEQHRLNQLRYYGIASGCCIAFENLLVAGIVFLNVTVFAVAYAKVAAAIFWVILFYRLPSQLTDYRWEWSVQKELIIFSLKTLTSELSRMLRFQADSLIAGRLLTPDLFGLYSFAKSAGLGIAQSLSQAYLSALYPFLCKELRCTSTSISHGKSAWQITFIMCALFLVQAFASSFYVTWLFDERWKDATTLVSLLCLIAIPTLLIDHHSLMLRAQNKPFQEMKVVMTCTIILIAGFLLIQPLTVYQVGLTGFACSLTWCLFLFSKEKQQSKPVYLRTEAI